MKSGSFVKNIVLAALGLVIFGTGILLALSLQEAAGIMRTLPYICIGIGTGLFGGNLGTALKKYIMKKNPETAKRVEIETNDERNIAISNKAKAKAYDLMQVVFGALIIAFALMQVDLYVILVLIAAYLFANFSMIFYVNRFSKEM